MNPGVFKCADASGIVRMSKKGPLGPMWEFVFPEQVEFIQQLKLKIIKIKIKLTESSFFP